VLISVFLAQSGRPAFYNASGGGILWLIKQWLKAAVVEDGEDGKRRTIGGGKVKQG